MCSRKWLIVAIVACGLASACSQYNTNLSVQTSSSVLTFVSPSAVTAGTQGFTITANGGGFTTGAILLWNQTPLTTTLISSIQMTALVPTSLLTTPGTVQVAVEIPGSATSGTNINSTTTTAISNLVLFSITAPPGAPPSIASFSVNNIVTSSAPYCGTQGITLTVTGTNFSSDSVLSWQGTTEPTTFLSATHLTAAIPASQMALPGSVAVTVANSLGTSNSLPFNLSTPAGGFPIPTLSSITPNTAPVGAGDFPAFTVTAQGTNILPCTVIQWVNGNNVTTRLATTFVPAVAPATSASAVAVVPAADLASLGNTNLNLINPGSPASANMSFTINAPTISALSSSASTVPSTTPACSPPGVTLTVTGTNFVNSSAVDWVIPPTTQTGTATVLSLPTTFVSPTQLTATLPPSYIAFPGGVTIQVSNVGILSNALPFTISPSSAAAPSNISLSQTTTAAGAAAFPLIVNGTNLLPCSAVQWTNGIGTTTPLATAYAAPTQTNPAQLVATVPAADITAVGTATLTVATPGAANSSNSISFQILLPTVTSLVASTTSANNTPYCSPSGLTLTVNGTNFAAGLAVNWNGSPRPTTFVSTTQLTAVISASDTAFLGTGAAAVAITVSGSSPATNSNSLKFPVSALAMGATLPAPSINSILPTSAALEAITGPPVALTVNGNALSPCSAVQWNGTPLPATIFIGTGGIASFIPAANITATGVNLVAVNTPAPTGGTGGGTSGTEQFSVYTPGSPSSTSVPGGSLSLPLMSASQRYAVYVLASTDGMTETPGTAQNIFVADNNTCPGAAPGCIPSAALVSAATNGNPGNADSVLPSINANGVSLSLDGRYVSFLSTATNLVTPGTNGVMQAFVHDTCAGVSTGCTPSTQLVSVSTGGVQGNGATTSATIDATGRYVTFESTATNLASVSSSPSRLFLRDTCIGVASGCTASTQPLN